MARPFWQVAKTPGAVKFRICAIRPSRTIGPTAIAAPAMVEVEGEGACWRRPAKRTPERRHEGEIGEARARFAAQKMVMELLVADQPARETSHDPDFEISGTGPRRSR